MRISAGSVAVPIALAPILAALRRTAPELRVEIDVDNTLRDIVAEGCDAGVRLGDMIAQEMVTVRLTPRFRTAIVAAPDYLARAGTPRTLAELAVHTCITYRLGSDGGLYRWELSADGGEIDMASGETVVIDDPLAARDLAVSGVGLAYVFRPLVAAALARGELVEVLPETAVEEPGFFLYFPRRAAMAPALRTVIDTARKLTRQG